MCHMSDSNSKTVQTCYFYGYELLRDTHGTIIFRVMHFIRILLQALHSDKIVALHSEKCYSCQQSKCVDAHLKGEQAYTIS